MRALREGIIKENTMNDYYSCVFMYHDDNLVTNVKLLRGQQIDGLLDCFLMKINEQDRLVYFTTEYRNLYSVSKMISESFFLLIVSKIIETFILVGKNDFLFCENLILDVRHVYINNESKSVKLVYIPVEAESNNGLDVEDVELNIRNRMIQFIQEFEKVSEYTVDYLQRLINDCNRSLFEINEKIIDIAINSKQYQIEKEMIQPNEINETANEKKLILKALDSTHAGLLVIDKKVFIIGKNSKRVDGVISYNNMVSRVHCKIIHENSEYYISDLNSSNGTFINGKRVLPGEKHLIESNDIIRIATVEFEIGEVIINEYNNYIG